MTSMYAGSAHSDIADIIEGSMSKLKEWLDMRLSQHEDILRCVSHSRELPASQGVTELAFKDMGGAVKQVRSTEYTQLHERIHRIHTHNLQEETQVQMITTQPVDFHSEGSLEDVPLPGSALDRNDTAACEKRISELETLPDTRAQDRSSEKRDVGSLQEWRLQEWESKLMDVFDELDLDRSGVIDCSEFMEAIVELQMPEVQGFKVFQIMDGRKTENGTIDRIEWLHLVEDAGEGNDEQVSLLVDFLEKLAVRQKLRGQIFDKDHSRRPWLILRHDSAIRKLWDITTICVLFYIAVSVPYSIGLGEDHIITNIDRASDVFFCCDVLLNFRTTYLDQEETVIMDGKAIACKYLKSWFCLDFLSSVPFDLITAGLLPSLTPARLIKVGKIAKVMKLLKFSKMMVLLDSEFIDELEKWFGGKTHHMLVRICKLASITFLLAHWLACFGCAVDSASLDAYFLNEIGHEPTAPQRYLAALYWALCTLSTVGYGDITPKSDMERAYSMLAMIIGGSLYGYVVGCVTSIVTSTDLNVHMFNERMDLFQSWLDRHHEIPRILRRRLKRHYMRALAAKGAMEDSSVVVELSPELRADTAFFLIHEHVRANAMFFAIPNSALAKLVEVLESNQTNSKEFIVQVGDPGIAMYILVNGTARYEQGRIWQPPPVVDNQRRRFQQVVEGDSFGEEIIFGLAETYTYTIITVSECEFHYITEDGFMARYQNMPELRIQMYAAFLNSRGVGATDIPRVTDLAKKSKMDRLGSYHADVLKEQERQARKSKKDRRSCYDNCEAIVPSRKSGA